MFHSPSGVIDGLDVSPLSASRLLLMVTDSSVTVKRRVAVLSLDHHACPVAPEALPAVRLAALVRQRDVKLVGVHGKVRAVRHEVARGAERRQFGNGVQLDALTVDTFNPGLAERVGREQVAVGDVALALPVAAVPN